MNNSEMIYRRTMTLNLFWISLMLLVSDGLLHSNHLDQNPAVFLPEIPQFSDLRCRET
jgi:hypothetical protein